MDEAKEAINEQLFEYYSELLHGDAYEASLLIRTLIFRCKEERGKICYKSYRISRSPVLDVTFGLFANLDNVGYEQSRH